MDTENFENFCGRLQIVTTFPVTVKLAINSPANYYSLFQTCPMKGRPEQSFLDTFSERFMNHVRQVNIILISNIFRNNWTLE